MSFEEPTPSAQVGSTTEPSEDRVEAFLEATTEGLGLNPELGHSARSRLQSLLIDSPELESATKRLKQPTPRWRKWIAPAAIAIVLIPLWGHSVWQGHGFYHLFQLFDAASSFTKGPDPSLVFKAITDPLSPDERLILSGDRSTADPVSRWKSLVDRFPEDPAYYSQYASVSLSQTKTLPKDFDATVDRLDPDNGWFKELKALEIGQGSYTIKRTAGSMTTTITDPSRHEESLALLHQAFIAPIYRSYHAELLERRCKLLPARHDHLMEMRCAFLISDSLFEGFFNSLQTSRLFNAGVSKAASQSQPTSVRELLNDWKLHQRQMSASADSTLLARMVERACLGLYAKEFSSAASGLSLEPEATKLKKVTDWFESEQRRKTSLPARPESPLGFAAEAFLGTGEELTRQTANWPPPGEDPMKHARAANQAFVGRAAMFACSLLILPIAGLIALHRFRHGMLIRKVSASLRRLVQASDLVWILGLGLAAPVAWLFIVRCSPWGSLSSYGAVAVPRTIGPQFLLMLFTVLMAVSLACRWRCLLRMPWLKSGLGSAWFTWASLAITAATIPFMQLWTEHHTWEMKTLLFPAAVPFLWLVGTLTRALFFTPEFPLGRVVVSRVVSGTLPYCAAGFALMLGAFYLEERRQITTDPLANDPSNIFAMEAGLARIINEENRMLLDMLERD